jgi:N-sulfoglucosamine sulfohydrolase
VNSQLLSGVDILPTLLEAAGAPAPDNLHGRSFLPAVQGRDYQPNPEIFIEKTYHCDYDPIRGLRTERYKYLHNSKPGTFMERQLDITGKPTEQAMEHLYHIPREEEELYDLAADPNEEHNLAGDPAHADTRRQLRARLDRWQRDTGDPLLEGDVPEPWPPPWNLIKR